MLTCRLLPAAVALALASTTPAFAGTEKLLRFTGTGCQEVITELPVSDPTLLRSEVPASWALTPSFFYGTPSVFVFVNQCDRLTAGGDAQRGTSVAWLATPATNDRSADFLYMLRNLTTHTTLAEALRRSHQPEGLVDGLETSITRSPADTILTGTGTGPDGAEAFSVEVAGVVPSDGALLGEQSYRFGRDGDAGLAQTHVRWNDIEWGIGAATVTAAPGSYLARLLGATYATGVGYVRQERMDGFVAAERPLCCAAP